MDYYVSSNVYSDECDGSQLHPYTSVQELLKNVGISGIDKINFKILIENENVFNEISKAQLKKELKIYKTTQRKGESKPSNSLSEKKVDDFSETIELDISLPKVMKTKISKLKDLRGKRVLIKGWVQHLRKQSKNLWFVTVRDPSGSLQVVFENKLCRTSEAAELTCESAIDVYGVIEILAEGNTAEGGHELRADHWILISTAPSGGIDSVLNKDSDPDVVFDNRHLSIRGDSTNKVMRMWDAAMGAFEKHYRSRDVKKTTAPAFVMGDCEGGSTLFKLDYFGKEANLTQSSQLYLEAMVCSIGDCYVIEKSFRAEKSRTRRHLSEYTHVEGESLDITFEELLDTIEDLLVNVSHLVLEIDGDTLLKVNPDYKPLKGPIRRMEYKDAIEFLRENKIYKPDDSTYEFGDDIPEGAERAMLAIIDEPLMLTKFPAGIKAFYMPRCVDDDRVTESVDVLLPGVGEVVGGSMRIWQHAELMAAYARVGLDPATYAWYTDLRLYGSRPHGGYGLGFERFLTWMLKKEHIRDVCNFPRYMGRCFP